MAIESIKERKGIAKVIVYSVPDRPGVAAQIFNVLGKHRLNIELISHSSGKGGVANVSFAVMKDDAEEVVKTLRDISKGIEAKDITCEKDMALLTLYGDKLAFTPGIASKVFSLLGKRNINIEMLSTSINSLNILVKEKDGSEAVRVMKDEFNID
jgi:aspartate kinase